MSGKRYSELKKQVEARVHAYKALARHRRPDVFTIEARLKELQHEYRASQPDRLQAVRARAQQVVVLETLAAALDTGGLRPLAELVNPDPVDFPRPARGSERWERAIQAHATSLADARAGQGWWRHLRTLNQSKAQQALLQEENERWQDMDSMRRRQWDRLERLEAMRPDPLAELRIRSANAPPPRLADIATQDLDAAAAPRQGGKPVQQQQPQSAFSLAAQLQQPSTAAPSLAPQQQQPALQRGASVGPGGGPPPGSGAPQQAAHSAATQQQGQQLPVATEACVYETRVSMQIVQGPLGAFVAPAPPRPPPPPPPPQAMPP